jgi:hypothetical protein
MPDASMKKHAGYYRPRCIQKVGWLKAKQINNAGADGSSDKEDEIGDYQKLNSA